MKIISTKDVGTLTIQLVGELDHHAARNAIMHLGSTIDRELPRMTILDLSGLSFMDSSGIAVIINLFRRMQELGGEFEISQIPPQAEKVINAAGLNKIIKIKAERKINV